MYSQVDSQPLEGFNNMQAVEVLRNTGKLVRLKLARYNHGARYEQLQQYASKLGRVFISSIHFFCPQTELLYFLFVFINFFYWIYCFTNYKSYHFQCGLFLATC